MGGILPSLGSQRRRKVKELLAGAHERANTPLKKPRLDYDEDGSDFDTLEDEHQVQIARLANIIGSHPSGMGPDTILAQLSTSLACALTEQERAALKTTSAIVLKYGPDLEKLADIVVLKVVANLRPAIDWFNKWTRVANPGEYSPIAGVLDEKLESVELDLAYLRSMDSKLVSMESAVQSFQSGGATTSHAFPSHQQPKRSYFQTGTAAVPTAPLLSRTPGNQSQGDHEIRLVSLQNQLDLLQDQLGGEQINVGGQVFRSRAELKSWWKVNVTEDNLFICYTDPHALLNISAPTSGDNSEILTFGASVKKAGHSDAQAALAQLSFGLPLPVVFGKETGKMGARDARVLPGLKKASDWDDGSPYRGQKLEATTLVNEMEKILRSMASPFSNLSFDAIQVASDCMTISIRFALELFSWMSKPIRSVSRSSSGSSVEIHLTLCSGDLQ